MATPRWQSGRLYPPGSIVVPRTTSRGGAVALTNPGFEDGATGWGTIGGGSPPAGWSFENTAGQAYQGSGYVSWSGTTDGEYLWNEAVLSVGPGTRVNVSAVFAAEGARDQAGGHVAIAWFDANGQQIGFQIGNQAGLGGYQSSSFSLLAPARAVTARIAIGCYTLQGGNVRVDAVSLQYTPYVQAGLQYRAVQSRAGYSSNAEPAWPGQLGQQVVDNEVIWEAVSISRVVWEARPIMRSGTVEPNWPNVDGARVIDGTISWVARTRRVTDPNCPRSKTTAILASKVFKGDKDIVRFSATTNPLDWSSERDAGYLPTGLQQANANDMSVLAPYRGNLLAFNPSCMQNWQVDPDPEQMAILDQIDGIGSSWQQAAQPVGGELFYLAQTGIRTVGISAAAANLQAGDIGAPVDELVLSAIASGARVLSTYYPGAGQFWLAFARATDTEVFVYSMTQVGQAGAWSRYMFPFAVEAFAQLGDDLYIRHGNRISMVSEASATDEIDGALVPFTGAAWWPWLDFGSPGMTKMMEGLDYVGTGQGPRVSVGYDQRDTTAFTPAYQLENDTMPGGLIPMPVSAPTLSLRFEFAGGERWNIQSVIVSLDPMDGGP